jgi:hypothetical protein
MKLALLHMPRVADIHASIPLPVVICIAAKNAIPTGKYPYTVT